jgi:hypothetical protein
MSKDESLPSKVELSRSEAIGIARLLWELLGNHALDHATRMAASGYAIDLETRALHPPWPTDGVGNAEVVAYLRRVRALIDEQLSELGE